MTPIEERTVRWIYRRPWYGPILAMVGIRTYEGEPGLVCQIMQADWRRRREDGYGNEPGREYFAVGLN
jgi:hypothetical protein